MNPGLAEWGNLQLHTMKSPATILTLAGICLCASCKTAPNHTRTAVEATGSMAQRTASGTMGTAAAAGRTGTGIVGNVAGGASNTVRSTAQGDLTGAGRAAVRTATTSTTGAVRGSVETGRRAGSTGVNTAADAARAAGDTVSPAN